MLQYFCTVCHKFIQLAKPLRPVVRTLRLDDDLPYEALGYETRGKCGHASEYIYVSTQRTRNRFGKSGSY